MLAIAGQMAGPNWMKFFREPMCTPGVTSRKKIRFFFDPPPFSQCFKIFTGNAARCSRKVCTHKNKYFQLN